jgi:hypothetical protein
MKRDFGELIMWIREEVQLPGTEDPLLFLVLLNLGLFP